MGIIERNWGLDSSCLVWFPTLHVGHALFGVSFPCKTIIFQGQQILQVGTHCRRCLSIVSFLKGAILFPNKLGFDRTGHGIFGPYELAFIEQCCVDNINRIEINLYSLMPNKELLIVGETAHNKRARSTNNGCTE